MTPFVTAAQDYLVTLKGDTLRGSVKLLSYDRLDRAEIKVDGKRKQFTALEARVIFHKNDFFHTVQLGDYGLKHMKVLKPGYLTLYGFRQGNLLTYDGRYLLKRNGDGIEVPGITFKKNMSDFLENCGQISTKIKSGELSRKDLDQIIDEYNSCVAQNKIVTPDVSSSTSQNVSSFDTLISNVEALSFASQKDALDILKDMKQKTLKNETIPNYLWEGLKSSLTAAPSLTEDFQKLQKLFQK